MKGAYKKFSKSFYRKNDAEAKKAAIKHFNSLGFKVEERQEDYRPDLRLYKGEHFVCWVECEIKHSWKGSTFPFPSVQFPERKQKYIRDKIIFFMLNHEGTHALKISGEELGESPLVEVSNKFVSEGELFFQVPTEKARFVSLS